MFGGGGFGSFRGIGMIVLQVLRGLTTIALLASCISCWALVIHVEQRHPLFVFECAALAFVSFFCLFLIISEFPVIDVVRDWYRRTWPIFSDFHGPSSFGIAVMFIGFNLLGKLNQSSFEQDRLGKSFWQLVMGASILDVALGALNVAGAILWMDRKNGITARDVRSMGSLAESPEQSSGNYFGGRASPAASIRNEKTKSKFMSMFWKKEDDEQHINRSNISGPIGNHYDIERDAGNESDDSARRSPIVPGLKRPDTALHPMHGRRVSGYSEAAMSRF